MLFLFSAALPSAPLLAADLALVAIERLSLADIRIEELDDDAIMLVVRKQRNVRSLLLTEAMRTGDDMLAGVLYSYWVPAYHPINGDERRILNGKVLRDSDRYYLVDSTPDDDDQFGQAFRIRIPYILRYGFPWTHVGTASLVAQDKFRFNIRTFEKPFADYCGAYRDNLFVIAKDSDE